MVEAARECACFKVALPRLERAASEKKINPSNQNVLGHTDGVYGDDALHQCPLEKAALLPFSLFADNNCVCKLDRY